MKKTILTILISILGLSTFTFSQNIGEIQAKFCQQKSEYAKQDIVTKAGQETPICLIFENNSDQDTKLQIDFVDGMLSMEGRRSCGIPEDPKTNFGQYMLNYDNIVNIPAKSQKQEIYKIKFPIGFSGVSHGCVSYNPIQEKAGGGVNVVFRKVHSIDILVGGDKVNSKIKVNKVSFSGDQISNQVVFSINNDGNVDQEVQISGKIFNIFGFSKNYYISGTTIKAGEQENLITQNIKLPSYKGVFSNSAIIFFSPVFNFDMTNQNLKQEYTIPGNIYDNKTLILFNRIYIFSIIIIIGLSIIVLRKYKKQ